MENFPARHGELDSEQFQTQSACDCTGLIPSMPQSKAEEESYDELYNFLPENPPKRQPREL